MAIGLGRLSTGFSLIIESEDVVGSHYERRWDLRMGRRRCMNKLLEKV